MRTGGLPQKGTGSAKYNLIPYIVRFAPLRGHIRCSPGMTGTEDCRYGFSGAGLDGSAGGCAGSPNVVGTDRREEETATGQTRDPGGGGRRVRCFSPSRREPAGV